MLGASSSDEDDDDCVPQNDDASDILGIPKPTFMATSASPRSESPAPSDSVSQANSLKRGDSSYVRRNNDSFRSQNNSGLANNRIRPAVGINNKPTFQSSQDLSDDDDNYSNEQSTPAHAVVDVTPKLSKEEQERIRAEEEEEERKQNLQLYVFVAKCVAYHFNAKQPTDMARRQLKVTKQELARIKDRFQAFLNGGTNIAADEAFTKAVDSYFEVFLKSERVQKVVQAGGFSLHDFREVFRCNVEKRIRSLPEIDGLSKDTVLTSWMNKFDTIIRGDEDAIQSRQSSKDQLYDMFQQILNVKKFEHQIIFNALQVRQIILIFTKEDIQLDNPDEQAAAIRREVTTREEMLREIPKMKKLMPKFVVKDMETLYIDEVRQSINLLISNLESVPVTPRGQGTGSRKKDQKSRSRQVA
uniref:Calcium-dependent secretion activator n=1 Tax=Steinernema glaseri TaxID=37863 RepID=A0A1I7ZKT1_9BILA